MPYLQKGQQPATDTCAEAVAAVPISANATPSSAISVVFIL
jgi:hypothetical protein